jgi:catechol 2,3-dioxygenase-like lactoylglutathione lyase family enzyme
MPHQGFSHVGLSTLDLDKTREFYEKVLGFAPVRCDIIKIKEGGQIRHVFFDTGRGQLLAFMEARGVPGIPADYDAAIHRGLGVPSVFYHFAFEAGSEVALREKRNDLLARGVDVTDVVDHDWAKSVYFKDPNGIQLEYCCFTRTLDADDARMQDRFEISVGRLGLEDKNALDSATRVVLAADEMSLDAVARTPGV